MTFRRLVPLLLVFLAPILLGSTCKVKASSSDSGSGSGSASLVVCNAISSAGGCPPLAPEPSPTVVGQDDATQPTVLGQQAALGGYAAYDDLGGLSAVAADASRPSVGRPANAIPEPSGALVFALGAVVVAAALRRRPSP